DGVEASAHSTLSEALSAAAAVAREADEGQAVEVVGGQAIRMTVPVAGVPDEDPEDPVEPEIPEEPEQPEEPEEPEEPVEPPPPVEYDGDHPFYAIAATMQYGEFRPVPVTQFPAGVSNMLRMNNTAWFEPG